MACRVVHLTSVHYAFDTRIYHKECKSLALAGYDVTLVAPHADGDHAQNGIRLRAVRPPRSRRERMTVTIAAVHQAAMRENPSICHFHDPELLPVGVLLKMQGKKVIYDVHEDYSGTMQGKQWIPSALHKPAALGLSLCEAALGRACDRIIAATPTIAKRFSPARTRLVQNFPWVDELRFPDALPYEQREPLAVYVGWLSDDRGAREMSRAIELAAKTLPVKLVVAGKVIPGAKAQFANDQASELVEHTGFLTRPQVAELLARAKVGLVTIHATRNAVNAQPTKLFEYMSVGLPVIASDFPVYRGIIESAGCGLLADPLDPASIADALVWLLRNPSQAAEMGRNGQRVVAEKYNWERESKSLIATYAELQGSNRVQA